MFRKMIGVTMAMIGIAVSAAALATSGTSGAASRKYTVAFVADGALDDHDPRAQAIVRGGRAAAKALGVQYIAAGSEGLFSLIERHVDAIATEGYDKTMTDILGRVRAAGILLLSSGDDIAAKRSVWVNFSNPAAYAEALADALASQIKGRGKYAIVRQQRR